MRVIALISVALQAVFVAAFIFAPLIWPDTLPALRPVPRMTTITLRKTPKPLRVTPTVLAKSTATSFHPATQQSPASAPAHGLTTTRNPTQTLGTPILAQGTGMNSTAGLALGLGSGTSLTPGPGITVVPSAAKSNAPVRVSLGVSAGLLLEPIRPIYPRIAIASHTEGTVVLAAIIDAQGHITGLHVVSGPTMLRSAATDAVKEARYKPYLLNGQATEVETTISVVFHMNG